MLNHDAIFCRHAFDVTLEVSSKFRGICSSRIGVTEFSPKGPKYQGICSSRFGVMDYSPEGLDGQLSSGSSTRTLGILFPTCPPSLKSFARANCEIWVLLPKDASRCIGSCTKMRHSPSQDAPGPGASRSVTHQVPGRPGA